MNNKVLIVVDMQNSFITGELANKEAEKIVPRIQKMIKEFDGEVIFTRDMHDKDYLETNEGRYLPVEHCIKGTFGSQIHRDLLGWRDAQVINKSVFGSLKLMDVLKSLSYGQNPLEIHLVGTVSSICVITNALLIKTFFPDVTVIVHRRCCADLDKKGQDAAMLIMERCQCEVVD